MKVRLPAGPDAGGFWKHGQEGFALLEGVWRGNAYWSGYGARVLPCNRGQWQMKMLDGE